MVHEAPGVGLPAAPTDARSASGVTGVATGGSFNAVLSQEKVVQGVVKFSAHASERLVARKIALSTDDLTRISEAADRAADKGSRESLFLLKNLGLIVNVKNRTVLTALDPERMREGIVTNIDSTVIIGT